MLKRTKVRWVSVVAAAFFLLSIIPAGAAAEVFSVSFAGEYDGLCVRTGDDFYVDVSISEGYESAKLYIAGNEACPAPENLTANDSFSSGNKRFHVTLSSDMGLGKCKMKVVAEYAGTLFEDSCNIFILDSEEGDVAVVNLDNMDCEDGTELTESNVITSDGRAVSRFDAKPKAVFHTGTVGDNSTPKIKYTKAANANLQVAPVSNSYDVKELSFDFWLEGGKGGLGFIADKGLPFSFNQIYYIQQNGLLKINNVSGTKSLTTKTWHNLKATLIKTEDLQGDMYVIYIDNTLYEVGRLARAATGDMNKQIQFIILRTTETAYIDNIVCKSYSPKNIVTGSITSYTVDGKEVTADGSAVDGHATLLKAALSESLSTSLAAVIDCRAAEVAGASVTVNAAEVSAALPGNLAAGEYRIKIPMGAERADGSALGGNLYIPFCVIQAPEKLSIVSPKNGEVVEHSATLGVSVMTTAQGAETKLYIDGKLIDSVVSSEAYSAEFTVDMSSVCLGTHTISAECDGQSDEISFKVQKLNVVSEDLQDFENVSEEQISDGVTVLYTVPQKINGVASGVYKKLVSDVGGHKNAAGVFMPAGAVQDRRNSFTSLLYLDNTRGHGKGVTKLNGNISFEYDFFMEDASDLAYLSFEWHKNVEGLGITNSSGAVQKTARVLFYPDGSSGFGNFIAGEKFFGVKPIADKTWYNVRFDFNMYEQICTVYIDGEPIKIFGFGTPVLYSGYKNSGNNAATLEDVGITDGKIGGITWVQLSHIKSGEHEEVIGKGNSPSDVCCYLVDNIKSVVYNPVPLANQYEPSYFYGTRSMLTVKLDRNYANLNTNKENIKLYINGTQTDYESVHFADRQAIITLLSPVAPDTEARVVFGGGLTLEDGTTVSGVSSETTLKCALYSEIKGLYLILRQSGDKLSIYGEKSGQARSAKILVCSYGSGNRLAEVKIKNVELSGKIEDEAEIANTAGAEKASVFVLDGNNFVTPLTEMFNLEIK